MFTLYTLTGRNLRWQNLVLLASSYIFYGFWDWRFLFLLLYSTVVDFALALAIERSADPRTRKTLLVASLCTSLGILGFFKYFGFFTASMVELLNRLGVENSLPIVSILLPVGVSFYTFQTMSYIIEVYRGKVAAATDFISFAAFVSFFPQLVAGPIERAPRMLPQFLKPRLRRPGDFAEGFTSCCWDFLRRS